MTDFVTASQIGSILGVGRTNVLHRAAREKWPYDERTIKGGRTKHFDVDHLPEAVGIPVKTAILKSRAIDTGVLTGLPPRPESSSPPVVASLTSMQQNLAHARLAVLAAAEDFARAEKLGRKKAGPRFCEVYNTGAIVIADEVRLRVPKVSTGTLRNWQRAYTREGLVGISGAKRGRHRKGRGHLDNDAEARSFIEGMLAGYPHATGRHIMRGMEARFRGRDLPLPSIVMVRRYISPWKAKNAQVFLALRNPDAWRSKYRAAAGTAGENITSPNEEWQLDSSPTDIMCGSSRHALIGVVDVYTRRLMFHVAKTSSAGGIAALLRRAILTWGVPKRIKTDNGSDYTAQHIKLLCAELGIEHELCPPYSPERKPFIERAFKTFQHGVVELMPGYIGHSVADRSDIRARSSFAERMEGIKGPTTTMSPQALQEDADRWCEAEYAHRPHEGLNGKTPFQMQTEWRGVIRRVENERALDILFKPVVQGGGWRTVGKSGIRADGAVYNAPELGGLEGSKVFVRTDADDVGRVFVFDENKQFVCLAIDLSIAGVSKRAIAAARRGRQNKVVNAHKAELRALAKESGVVNIAHEILADAEAQAAGITAFPQRAETHSTDELVQADKAAAAAEDQAIPFAARQPAANDAELSPEERATWFGTDSKSVPKLRYKSRALTG